VPNDSSEKRHPSCVPEHVAERVAERRNVGRDRAVDRSIRDLIPAERQLRRNLDVKVARSVATAARSVGVSRAGDESTAV
jgi:hypothetical protein